MIRLQWTPEIDLEMDDLLKSKTTKQVAAYLSWKYGVPVTKNMVCGRRFRLRPHEKRRPKMDLFGKSLDELTDKDCRYAYGDQAPYRFCGKPSKSGSSYCELHHAACWKKPEQPNPQTAFRTGRPKHQAQARAA